MTVDSDPSLVPVSVVTGDPSAVLPEGPVVTLPDPLLPLIPPPSLSPLITPSVTSLNDDGVILTPPPSPFADDEPSPTLPSDVIFDISHFDLHHPPETITHLLALPAVHHSRPVILKTQRKPSLSSKSLLSLNPFACLSSISSDLSPLPDPPTPSPPSSSLTTPAVGSFLETGENNNL
ncbi:hypothetical protein Bca52824_055853 [Brassica carinata]|uniref:Uncharacterized protein n=1 Tax=Brassica carinata TaxID=52824 RepID=A0A8X7R8E0_BRACI|nr:hypothetical protein Bca52824_055853 [Brassica carinata]